MKFLFNVVLSSGSSGWEIQGSGKDGEVVPSVVFSLVNYIRIRFLGIESRDDDTMVEDPNSMGFSCCFVKMAALLLELFAESELRAEVCLQPQMVGSGLHGAQSLWSLSPHFASWGELLFETI